MKKGFFLFLFSALVLIGCDFFCDSTRIEIFFPCLPAGCSGESSPVISHWRVFYPDKMNCGLAGYSETVVRHSDAGTPLSISAGVNLPLLAYPVFGGAGWSLPGGFPAAAIYPADLCPGGTLVLDWESGPAAEVLRSASGSSGAYRGFDAERLRTLIIGKAAETAEAEAEKRDLWMIDPAPILCRLGYGVFRESAVRRAETMDFEIPAESGAVFYSDNPFREPLRAGTDGVLRVRIPENRKTSFFSGDGTIVTAYFNESVWCWRNSASGLSGFGKI